ncbi:DUF3164 family protein [Pseudoalteromonas luteoviolacea]|uniref:DUF3164 family protein n=1 Tax=Pseudoalteromonas luteoviolacea TaxID=43657 RepID=UPI00114FE172|nr:DUF3164 family protein [Pseudoalteromonas luteoviolacea]TQF71767.1 DUF3164 family protein [Pseudoalteromonas luteoviolacea]
MEQIPDIPDGFMMDAKGNLVAKKNIKPVDLLRSELVEKLTARAVEQQQKLIQFKSGAFTEVDAFVDLSASEYGEQLGGKKGNITLLNFDCTQKVTVQISERRTFDERLQVAKNLIDECIRDWSDDADDRVKTLVEHAFQVDKQGQVSLSRILGLRKLDMRDERWDSAMKAIADSIQITDSKEYIRFYQRKNSDEKFEAISLDIAAI